MAKLTNTEVKAIASVIVKIVNVELDELRKKQMDSPALKARVKEIKETNPDILKLNELAELKKEIENSKKIYDQALKEYADKHEGSSLNAYNGEVYNIESEKSRIIERIVRIEKLITVPTSNIDDWELTNEILAENTRCGVAYCDLHDYFLKKTREKFGLPTS